MLSAEAKAALDEDYSGEHQGKVTVHWADQSITAGLERLGVTWGVEDAVEKAVSLVAENYYIQGQIRGIMEEWQGISIEEISKWENYAALRNQSEPDYKTLGTIWVYLDATTMTGTTDEEEYKMYEEVFQKEMGGQALFYVYYLDKKNFQQAEKILEVRAPGDEGSSFEEIIENQPYFGTIMRSNSKTFDDSLEVFKAAKRGEEQEIFQ